MTNFSSFSALNFAMCHNLFKFIFQSLTKHVALYFYNLKPHYACTICYFALQDRFLKL